MLTAAQQKEHVLNRLGYGQSVWHSARFDALGQTGYINEQLSGTQPAISQTGTTIAGKLERDVLATRQLEAALLDFWFNHFNIDTGSTDPEKVDNSIAGRQVGHHQNVAILPHVLGDFGTMLLETAKSPSMLDYLDNRVNFEEEVVNGNYYGGNDNYAREVMELHTIGVNGGYDEIDITEVARILTGWSVTSDAYAFKQARHDFNTKTVMGVFWPAGVGEQEGIDFLAWLANLPAAATFLSSKLIARFVGEDIPAGVTAAAGAAYGANRDLGAMTAAMFGHPDFFAPSSFRSKVKPPHRFVASALQAMGATAAGEWAAIAEALVASIIDAGEVPYVVGPPTGYPERADFWISGTSMLSRFETAELIAYEPSLRAALRTRSGASGEDPVATVDEVAAAMVPGGLSDASRFAVMDHVAANGSSNDGRVSAAAHLIMCSPEFVRY
ncbi:MAG: DUF1800 domain-containing protein [Actinomycetota bacterium]